MSVRADPTFLRELKNYGAFDISACFNCGNCTAICPLSTDAEVFPRRLIRYGQLGLRERLLSSSELWLCYYCGECSDTCPREAEPGEFMASARRLAIAQYDITGLARALYTSPWATALVLIVAAAVLAGIMLAKRGPMTPVPLALFEFIPASVIHDVGVVVLVIVAVVGLVNALRMVYIVSRAAGSPPSLVSFVIALVKTVIVEVLGQQRYRECDAEKELPWIVKPWFIHAAMAWGFFGLLAATAANWLLDLAGIKPTGTMVPLWYPVRLLGTVAGVFLVYGSTAAIVKRLYKPDKPTSHSLHSDWVFLLMLWAAGVTGYAVEISLYLSPPQLWAYYVFIVHVVVSMELVLLAPFTKFAHVFYRTVALAVRAAQEEAQAPVPQEA